MPHSNKGHHGGKSSSIAAKNVTEEDVRFLQRYGDQLSKTTLRAKWIHAVDEHEDHTGQSLATRSHEVIRQWAEDRGAQPSTVPGTEHQGRAGVLRFNFPGYGGQTLEAIDWEDWFRTFDERDLVFIYQEHKADGRTSNFFKLDSPHREHD